MLMLLFHVGKERYTCSCDLIQEIVPCVALRKVPQVPDYVVGLLKYGGLLIPVVDFSVLTAGRPSTNSLSTRIILFDNKAEGENRQLMGVLAERVTETIDKDERDFLKSGVTCRGGRYLSGVLADEEGIIQFVSIEELFKTIRRVFIECEV